MTDTAKALYAFFSGFGLPAFTEYDVPDEFPDEHGVMQKVKPPYITYQVVEPDWMDSAPLYARIWFRDTGYVAINAVADAIKEAVGGGITLPTENGFVMLTKGTPFMQNMPMEGDDTLKVVYLLLSVMAFT